jgi:hypothetical protein
MNAVIKPYSQSHIGIIEDRRRDTGHSRYHGITEEDGVKAVRDVNGDRLQRFSRSVACTIVTPVSECGRPVNQSELEFADTVKIDSSDRNATLIIDELRNL